MRADCFSMNTLQVPNPGKSRKCKIFNDFQEMLKRVKQIANDRTYAVYAHHQAQPIMTEIAPTTSVCVHSNR